MLYFQKESIEYVKYVGVKMRNLMQYIAWFNRKMCKVLEVIIGIDLMLLTVLIFVSVLMRYAFNKPVSWGGDASLILLIWMAMLGAPLGMKNGQHIAIEMAKDKLPLPILKIVNFGIVVLILFVDWVFFYYGLAFSLKGMARIVSSIDWLPYGYAYLALPVGFLLMIPVCVEQAIHLILDFKKPLESKRG